MSKFGYYGGTTYATGTDIGTVIDSGGTQILAGLDGGGITSGVTIDGGVQIIGGNGGGGGTTFGTIINSGGLLSDTGDWPAARSSTAAACW